MTEKQKRRPCKCNQSREYLQKTTGKWRCPICDSEGKLLIRKKK